MDAKKFEGAKFVVYKGKKWQVRRVTYDNLTGHTYVTIQHGPSGQQQKVRSDKIGLVVKRVTKRKCPTCSSALVPGETKRGLDGEKWVSNMMANGAYRWQRVSKAKSKPSKARRPTAKR